MPTKLCVRGSKLKPDKSGSNEVTSVIRSLGSWRSDARGMVTVVPCNSSTTMRPDDGDGLLDEAVAEVVAGELGSVGVTDELGCPPPTMSSTWTRYGKAGRFGTTAIVRLTMPLKPGGAVPVNKPWPLMESHADKGSVLTIKLSRSDGLLRYGASEKLKGSPETARQTAINGDVPGLQSGTLVGDTTADVVEEVGTPLVEVGVCLEVCADVGVDEGPMTTRFR